MNNHDPETTPLPAPVPGLGTASIQGEDAPVPAVAQVPRSLRTTQPGLGGILPQTGSGSTAVATSAPAPTPVVVAPSSVPLSRAPLPGVRLPDKLPSAPLPGVRLPERAPASASPIPETAAVAPASARTPSPSLGPASAQSMPRPLPSQVSGPLALTPLPTPYRMTPPAVQAAAPGVGMQPAAAPARKPWLLLGGLGVVAVAAAIAAVALPGKPSAPELASSTGSQGQSGTAGRNQPPAPVPVVPVEPTAPPAPSEPATARPAPGHGGEPGDARHTASRPDKGHPDKAPPGTPKDTKVAARPATPEKRPPDKPDKPDKPEKKGKGEAVSLEPVPSLTPQIQRQVMVAAESKWKACAQDAFGSMLTISIAVEPSGSVQKADILGTLGSTTTGRCITDQVRKLRFPPFTEAAPKKFVWSYQVPQGAP